MVAQHFCVSTSGLYSGNNEQFKYKSGHQNNIVFILKIFDSKGNMLMVVEILKISVDFIRALFFNVLYKGTSTKFAQPLISHVYVFIVCLFY